MKDISNHLVHLNNTHNPKYNQQFCIFFYLLHSIVHFNMEEKICCYFHLIVTLSSLLFILKIHNNKKDWHVFKVYELHHMIILESSHWKVSENGMKVFKNHIRIEYRVFLRTWDVFLNWIRKILAIFS